jgi:hypothetical protein
MQTAHLEPAIRSNHTVLTKEVGYALLIKANILDANGNYDKRFFSAETIKKDMARRQGK